MSLPSVIAHLRSVDRITDLHLAELSGLSREELVTLQSEWSGFTSESRLQIVKGLLKLSDADSGLSFEGIFRQLLDDTDAEIRRRAIKGLWECEGVWLIEPLINLLNTDNSPAVSICAAEALGRFAILASCGKLPDASAAAVTQALLDLVDLSSAPVELVCQALESVAALILPEVTAAITWAGSQDDDRLQLSAVRAMGRSCDATWFPMLLTELTNRDPELRREAVKALGQLGEEDALPYLADLVYDENVRVRVATVRALGELGGPEAVESLKQALQDKEEAVTGATEETLESLASLDDASLDFQSEEL